MSKRKTTDADDADNISDASLVDAELTWRDPEEIDFHGLKTLLKQLFDTDNTLVDTSGLSDLIISQPHVGSTVKVPPEDDVDAKENDPFAFITALNLQEHSNKEAIQGLKSYLTSKAKSIPALADSALIPLLDGSNPSPLGLILSERFINMPTECVPPLYNMLVEEIQDSITDGKPFSFSHYLILSKKYAEVESTLDTEESRPGKKKRKGGARDTFYFHPEDEVLEKLAIAHGEFEYTNQDEGTSDSRRAFQEAGIKPVGHMIFIEAGDLTKVAKEIESYFSPAT